MKKIFIILTVLLLVGCKTAPPAVEYVTKTEVETIVLEPSKELYGGVSRIKPPNMKAYLSSNWEEKEKTLFNHIHKQDNQIDALINDRNTIAKQIRANKELAIPKPKKDTK